MLQFEYIKLKPELPELHGSNKSLKGPGPFAKRKDPGTIYLSSKFFRATHKNRPLAKKILFTPQPFLDLRSLSVLKVILSGQILTFRLFWPPYTFRQSGIIYFLQHSYLFAKELFPVSRHLLLDRLIRVALLL